MPRGAHAQGWIPSDHVPQTPFKACAVHPFMYWTSLDVDVIQIREGHCSSSALVWGIVRVKRDETLIRGACRGPGCMGYNLHPLAPWRERTVALRGALVIPIVRWVQGVLPKCQAPQPQTCAQGESSLPCTAGTVHRVCHPFALSVYRRGPSNPVYCAPVGRAQTGTNDRQTIPSHRPHPCPQHMPIREPPGIHSTAHPGFLPVNIA